MHSRRLWAACVGLACVCSAAHGNDVDGAWQSPAEDNWPLIPIHASLTPDGRVLTFGSNTVPSTIGIFAYDVWDPAVGLDGEHLTLPNYTQTEIFCSFQLLLPDDGRIVLFGGDIWDGTLVTNVGNDRSTIFDFRDNSLTSGDTMSRQRWYASAVTLMNGEVYVQGGSAVGTSNGGNAYSEIRDAAGYFRRLDNVRPDSLSIKYYYPRIFVAPDGRVFGIDSIGKLFYVTTTGSGSLTTVGSIDKSLVGISSSVAMFRPGKILVIGGNSNSAVVIDINGPVPVVTPTSKLSSRRAWSNATIMPDGRVLVTGGSARVNSLEGVNNNAEIWDPTTGEWTVGAAGARTRQYHSFALLLPDASVLVGGGTATGELLINNLHSEIYYPPYLFSETGEAAPRLQIDLAPETLEAGVDFSMTIGAGEVARVTLLRAGAVTHSVNLAQNFVELGFTQTENIVYAEMPDRATDVPPGFYLLFVIDAAGMPSIGRIVRIGPTVIESLPDSTPPSRPESLAVALNNGNPSLTWSTSSDDVGVAGYSILRSEDGAAGPEFALTDSTSWTDTAVTEGTAYTYAVRAYDAAGNIGDHSSLETITAFKVPTKPGNFKLALLNQKPKLTFSASSDNVGVAGYNVYRSTNGSMGSLYAQIPGSPWVDTAAQKGVKYTYAVRARDAAGYLSSATALKSITSK